MSGACSVWWRLSGAFLCILSGTECLVPSLLVTDCFWCRLSVMHIVWCPFQIFWCKLSAAYIIQFRLFGAVWCRLFLVTYSGAGSVWCRPGVASVVLVQCGAGLPRNSKGGFSSLNPGAPMQLERVISGLLGIWFLILFILSLSDTTSGTSSLHSTAVLICSLKGLCWVSLRNGFRNGQVLKGSLQTCIFLFNYSAAMQIAWFVSCVFFESSVPIYFQTTIF